jgi:hypothetical protein
MSKLGIQELMGTFVKKIGETVKENPTVPGLFRSWFTDDVSAEDVYMFDEQVDIRKVLKDDGIYSTGQGITFDKNTTKAFKAPIYKPWTAINGNDAYNRVIGGSDISAASNNAAFVKMGAENVLRMHGYMDRTEELLCATALQTGTVVTLHGDSIDFKMKSTHKIAYDAANDIGISTVDPAKVFPKFARLIAQDGNVDSKAPIEVLLGTDVLYDLQTNPFVQARMDIKFFQFGQLSTGLSDAKGRVPQGVVTYEGYTFYLYTYAEEYIHPDTGVSTMFMNPKGLLMKPMNADLKMFYAGISVPTGTGMYGLVAGKRLPFIYDDKRAKQTLLGFETRPLPILRRPNQILFAVTAN